MNAQDMEQEAFYVCAGICRPDPETNQCLGCGRPWEFSPEPAGPQQMDPVLEIPSVDERFPNPPL